MGIDWFTFGAQAVNLVVLILLLRHFLYRPVMRAMDRREQKIASRLEEAEQRRREAREQAEENQRRGEELERRREELMVEVRQEVDRRRKEMLREARAQVDEERDSWREALERERGAWLEGLRRDAGEEIYHGVKQALRDLADRDCERQMIEVFLGRLEQAGAERREALAASLEDGQINIRSAHAIPEEQQPRLEQALRELSGREPRITFETDEALVCGIEVGADGHCIGWSVREYLAALERNLEQALDQGHEAAGAPEAS